MKNIFTEHPRSINETYFQHMRFSIIFSGRLFLAAFMAFTHAFFPFLFKANASRSVAKMVTHFVANARKSTFDAHLRQYIVDMQEEETEKI